MFLNVLVADLAKMTLYDTLKVEERARLFPRFAQWHASPQSSQHPLPLIPSIPSLAMIGHHHRPRHRISPPPTEQRIQKQAAQQKSQTGICKNRPVCISFQ
jgi:hypothetical protein